MGRVDRTLFILDADLEPPVQYVDSISRSPIALRIWRGAVRIQIRGRKAGWKTKGYDYGGKYCFAWPNHAKEFLYVFGINFSVQVSICFIACW